MQGSSLSSQAVREAARPAALRSPLASSYERHYRSILDVEAVRLARELRSLGPMSRERLAYWSGAGRWRQGSFDAAVRHGIATGKIRALPYGYLAAGTAPSIGGASGHQDHGASAAGSTERRARAAGKTPSSGRRARWRSHASARANER
jgi:hypothetical protein